MEHAINPWVVFKVIERVYALSSDDIREMVSLAQYHLTVTPNSPAWIRGVINLRGKIIPVIDLRVRLGYHSLPEEMTALAATLKQREEDHHKWVAELERCVKENCEFKLTTDPHKCKFGVWYDQFKTEDQALSVLLQSFDTPHKAIHAAGKQVIDLMSQGQSAQAQEVVTRLHGAEMQTMVRLFGELIATVQEPSREIAMVLDGGGRNLALAVDAVTSVEHLKLEPLPDFIEGVSRDIVSGIGHAAKGDEIILILNAEALLGDVAAGEISVGE